MVLKFVFVIESNNGVLEKILIRVAKNTNIKLGLSRNINKLYAYIQGEEKEIDEFSRQLSSEMPLSIFLKSLDAVVDEEFKDDLKREFPDINLPPCPKCLKEVKDENNSNYYNPFHHCEVCGYKNIEFKKNDESSYKEVFEKLAEKLKNEGKIYIQTMNGKYEVMKDLEEAEQIVAMNLSAIANYFMSFEGDARALGSIEKPLVRLKTNLTFKKEFGISKPAFNVKLPDCMILELLCNEINKEINLIGLKKSERSDDFSFETNGCIDDIPVAVVTDTRDHEIVLQSGERGILPKFEKSLGNVTGKNGSYIAVSDENKTVLMKKDAEGYEAKKSFAGFFGVLEQWDLNDKTLFGYAFYKNDENKILVNSPKFGLIEYIDFNFKFKNYEEIFASIRTMNETGMKLVENYSKKAGEEFQNALNSNLDSQKTGIAYLWGLIGIILGFADNIDEAYEKLLQYADFAMAKKGPRIDYKMQSKNLDPLWAIRTAMSFKLAGVDNYLISFGAVESFAEFLSNHYDQFNKETPLDGAIIVGDLFEGEFLNKIYTYVKKNYKTYIPKALPVSGAVEAFGSCVIKNRSLTSV